MSDASVGMPNAAQPLSGPGGRAAQSWYTFWNSLRTARVPSGAQFNWAGPTVPDGYLLCDGSAVSRSGFAALFGQIGVYWGPGDGSTTFNLPNLIGVVTRGSTVPGQTGGSDSSVLTIAQLPAHSHAVDDPGHLHAITDPGHAHTYAEVFSPGADIAAGSAYSNTTENTGVAATGVTIQDAFTGVTTEDTGGGLPIPTLPAYRSILPIIKT